MSNTTPETLNYISSSSSTQNTATEEFLSLSSTNPETLSFSSSSLPPLITLAHLRSRTLRSLLVLITDPLLMFPLLIPVPCLSSRHLKYPPVLNTRLLTPLLLTSHQQDLISIRPLITKPTLSLIFRLNLPFRMCM